VGDRYREGDREGDEERKKKRFSECNVLVYTYTVQAVDVSKSHRMGALL
jgi:hypothetical protein